MKQHTITTYSYDELTDKAKEKALERLYDINVDYDWWEFIYEDAERVGLKIKAFDLDRRSYVDMEYINSAEETAWAIQKEHGDTCDTYKDATNYLAERDKIIEDAPRDENGDFEDEYELDKALDEHDAEFLESLSEDYRIMLQKEYEYLTSREAIEETIRTNEYEFTEDGKLY